MQSAESPGSLFGGPPATPSSLNSSVRHSTASTIFDSPTVPSTPGSVATTVNQSVLGFDLQNIASSLLDGIEDEIARFKATLPPQLLNTVSISAKPTARARARSNDKGKTKVRTEVPVTPAPGIPPTTRSGSTVTKKKSRNIRPPCSICSRSTHGANRCWFFAVPGLVPGSMVLPNMTPENLRKLELANHPALPQGVILISAFTVLGKNK